MKRYKHLFFDLDHTLWDFDVNSRHALQEIFEEERLGQRGIEDFDYYHKVYKEINHECWAMYRRGELEKAVLRTIRFERTLKHFGIHDDQLTNRVCDRYIEISPRKTNLIPGTQELLEHLVSKNYNMHIITNGFEEVQHVKLEMSDLRRHFDLVITSEMAGVKKPHPDIFHEALNRSGAATEHSLMIGDDLEADVVGARNMGMDQVYFNPEGKPHREKVTFEVRSLLELCDLLA